MYGFDPIIIHLFDDFKFSSPVAEECLNRKTTVYNQVYNTVKQINHKQSAIHLEKARHFNVVDWVLVDRRILQVNASNIRLLTNK